MVIFMGYVSFREGTVDGSELLHGGHNPKTPREKNGHVNSPSRKGHDRRIASGVCYHLVN